MLRLGILALLPALLLAQLDDSRLQPLDVFDLEYASDPQISPDGERVAYVRNFFDIMTDRARSNLWIVSADGADHRALTSGNENHSAPRWSPDGSKLLYVSGEDGSSQLYLRWMDTGQTVKLTNLTSSPGAVSWSPDGSRIVFSMLVSEKSEPFAKMPAKPEGAEWAEPPRVITKLRYRYDGQGYPPQGRYQYFVIPAEGGAARQLTDGSFDHRAPVSWSPDSKSFVFSANRREDADYQARNTEIYELQLADRSIRALTDREGPDNEPAVSPDGKQIAYTGYDDRLMGYNVVRLYVMDRDGGNSRPAAGGFDRDVVNPTWSGDGRIYFQYDDQGVTKIGYTTSDEAVEPLAQHIGGTTLGRPYPSGSFTMSRGGRVAYTVNRPERPADIAWKARRFGETRLTALNEDLLGHKSLGRMQAVSWKSSADGRDIQGWALLPPGIEEGEKRPLVLEIHGGPFSNYGERFSAEGWLYAAAGYVVLFSNPRGSTSYGEEFGNLIHHDYPGQDYDDLMSGVDAMIERGWADPDRLFVTGGSGGGVLSAWIVGKTNRFKAAVVAKPVINWYAWILTTDIMPTIYNRWFPGPPWEHAEHYLRRSPISLVGNVTTPTMVMTGEADLRTPIPESEEFYQALKLRKVDTALVRIPGAYHDITARPSNLIAKVAHVLEWFRRHDPAQED